MDNIVGKDSTELQKQMNYPDTIKGLGEFLDYVDSQDCGVCSGRGGCMKIIKNADLDDDFLGKCCR